jgi:hypothetical protein
MKAESRGNSPLPPPVDLKVLRLAKGQVVYVRALCSPYKRPGHPVLGYFTHWVKGRSKVCAGVDVCEPAMHRIDPVWYAFLPFQFWDEQCCLWVSAVLQITESLELDFRDRLERGQTWTITRGNAKKAGNPLRGELTGTSDPALWQKPFDVLNVLRVLFNRKDLGDPSKPNPCPSRLALTPDRGQPPPGSKAAEMEKERADVMDPAEQRRIMREAILRWQGAEEPTNGKG